MMISYLDLIRSDIAEHFVESIFSSHKLAAPLFVDFRFVINLESILFYTNFDLVIPIRVLETV